MKVFFSFLFTTVLAISLAGCPSTPVKPNTQTFPPKKVRIGLALGGGAAKGFAHIGVIKVLENAGIKPDIVTGTSAGSVVGSLYASGLTGFQIQEKALTLQKSDVADFTLSFKGLIKGEKLQQFINDQVGNKLIQQFPIRFAAVAADFDTGKKIIFTQGNTGQAVRASSSIPNVFQPVFIGRRRYVDGGLVSPVPVSAARTLGADIVIAVDISARPANGSGSGIMSILDQSLTIMNKTMLEQELKQADVVITPQVLHFSPSDFSKRNEAIMAGEKAAQQALPKIRQIIANKR